MTMVEQGKTSPVFIIAEAGVNHNGSEQMALRLVETAAQAGADAVKFQTFKAENLVTKSAAAADYQRQQTGNTDQFTMLKNLELSENLHLKIIAHCRDCGIEFMSTPFDLEAAEFLVSMGMARIKVPSGELTNLPFIEALSTFNKPMILSTGMANLEEVSEAVEVIQKVRKEHNFFEPLPEKLTLLHCTSNYPARNEDVNLKAMQTMAMEMELPVGYSDHTEGTLVSAAAVAIGASVIEKHFTLDRCLPGPDHQASLEPEELKLMIRQIRQVEACLGNGEKTPTENELPIRDLVRRSVTLTTDKAAGLAIMEKDLALLRPGSGIAPKHIDEVVGRRLKTALSAGTALTWQDLI